MISLIGRSGSFLLFSNDEQAVVVDADFGLITETGSAPTLYALRKWKKTSEEVAPMVASLVNFSLAKADDQALLASTPARKYSIPKAAQAEAKKALEWRKEHGRGGTPVGINSARTLANGGQIGIEKVRHIAKYFPRHEVDKKGKGWSPGEDGFPSNGRIAWALWGGDAAQRWAADIVESAKNALKADAYVPQAQTDPFEAAHLMDETYGPEFMARVRLDGSGLDRLYKVDIDGQVYVWDGEGWDDLGHVDGDVWSYDSALDDPYDMCEKSHLLIDPSSAIMIAARLAADPDTNVSVFDLDADEAEMHARSIPDIDWDMVDYGISAAGAPMVQANDGKYTPEERAKNASKQVRDSGGKFASNGKRAQVGKEQGTVTAVDGATQNVTVKLDSGQSVTVPGKGMKMIEEQKAQVKPAEGEGASPAGMQEISSGPLDTTGILGQPRTPIDRPNARIPGTLPALTKEDLHQLLYDFPAWVQSQRIAAGAEPIKAGADKADVEEKKDKKPKVEAYSHPLLQKWLERRKRSETESSYDTSWAGPVVAAADTKEAAKPAVSPEKETQAAEANPAAQAPKPKAPEKPVELTPQTSDVQPMYFAIVAPEDATAVLDLVSMVPASSTSTSPMVYRRLDKKWVRDEKTLADLKSATPPPVIPLDTATLNDVLKQIDGITASAAHMEHSLMVLWGPRNGILTAAGGADRNRGNAEELRKYWTVGKGAAKIRWGTGGDWTRCVRQLEKYMGPRAKGYCALRHKEVTGMWTGDKMHRAIYGRNKGKTTFSTDVLKSSEMVVSSMELAAKAAKAKSRFGMVASADAYATGTRFSIPLVIPEGVETGDGRMFRKGSITTRELPLPLLWQIKTSDGHAGSVVVGRIDRMERIESGIGNAIGIFDDGEYGKEAERLVRHGFIRGVSADMDQFEAEEQKKESKKTSKTDAAEDTDAKDNKVGGEKMTINKARVMAVTMVPKPAFQECKIFIVEGDEEQNPQEETMVPDGIYVEDVESSDEQAVVASAILAGAVPIVPPADWFNNPKLKQATPITVDDNGRVFGHIAAWNVDHIGLVAGTKPPRSRSGYSYFHTGVVRTDSGKDVPVGQLTLAGGHASLEASALDAVKHYDDTASAVADVHAGEDAYGIWVAGALRTNATDEQIRALRASAPSGDWRPIRGSLELVAVCQVNVPGFPIARARVASGQVMALVAAGASYMAHLKAEDPELGARVASAKAKFDETRAARSAKLAAKAATLTARVASARYADQFADISPKERTALAKKGQALSDGSYPIRNEDDLKNAIQAFGRAKESDRARVRRHIMRRARQLDLKALIPEKWSKNHVASTKKTVTASADADLRARVAAAMDRLGKANAVEPVIPEERPVAPVMPRAPRRPMGIQDPVAKKDSPVAEIAQDGVSVKEALKIAQNPNVRESFAPGKYIPGKTQPRDNYGKFRRVLARLKQDLGVAGLDKVAREVAKVEGLNEVGSYTDSAAAAGKLIDIVDRLDSGSLNARSLENIRSTTSELGKVIANLPLPFDNPAQKVRYSDLPPALQGLIEDMISRVEAKIGQKDADIATAALKSFKSGGDVYGQSDISSQVNKLLRLLT
jgi:hypothetical protein